MYASMEILHRFNLVPRLTTNINRTRVIQIGAWRDSRIILCPELKLLWTQNIESLRVTFDILDVSNIALLNLKSRN